MATAKSTSKTSGKKGFLYVVVGTVILLGFMCAMGLTIHSLAVG